MVNYRLLMMVQLLKTLIEDSNVKVLVHLREQVLLKDIIMQLYINHLQQFYIHSVQLDNQTIQLMDLDYHQEDLQILI